MRKNSSYSIWLYSSKLFCMCPSLVKIKMWMILFNLACYNATGSEPDPLIKIKNTVWFWCLRWKSGADFGFDYYSKKKCAWLVKCFLTSFVAFHATYLILTIEEGRFFSCITVLHIKTIEVLQSSEMPPSRIYHPKLHWYYSHWMLALLSC